MDPIFSLNCAAGAVLLLPAPCSSGISRPSLAIDLLLNTYPAKRVAVSKSSCVQPFVSSAATDRCCPGLVTAALELHALSDGVFVLQQRAPLFEGCAAAYMDGLLQWIQSQSFAKIIFVAEAPAHRKVDTFLRKGTVFALENAEAGTVTAAESATVHCVSRAVGCRALGDKSFAAQLVTRLSMAKPSLSCIFTFSSGDPVASSFELAAEAARLLALTGCSLQQPASWSRSLLSPIDQSIFG
jgi:predicted ATP-grasp superfamily ATP-dependent carboligase